MQHGGPIAVRMQDVGVQLLHEAGDDSPLFAVCLRADAYDVRAHSSSLQRREHGVVCIPRIEDEGRMHIVAG
jgi:hypothetical protein